MSTSVLRSRATNLPLPTGLSASLLRLCWGVALPVVFLCGLGMASIHVTERSAAPANVEAHASLLARLSAQIQAAIGNNTLRQAVFVLSGVALLLASQLVSYQKIGRYAYPAYWIVIGLLVLLVLDRFIDLPLIPVKRATRRWVEFGAFSLQPSEFVKVALILALARYLRFRDSYRRWSGLLAPFLLTLLPMLLILVQPDLGTLLMLLPLLFCMLFVAGARLRHFATVLIVGLATLPVFYIYGMQEYQKVRVEVVLRQYTPDERWHREGPGFQLRQSKVALGTGGVWGEGYGKGAFVDHSLLPEEHNDFIFAIVGHQWGFVGSLLVILSYALIVLFGIEVATLTNDPFGRLLAVGVVVMIVTQAFINIGMTIGLAPITGMTLPFVSYGGSSMWANFVALGLLVNIALRRPMLIAKPPFQHRD